MDDFTLCLQSLVTTMKEEVKKIHQYVFVGETHAKRQIYTTWT